MTRTFYVITGGTMVHVAPHFSLCAPAYGRVGTDIAKVLTKEVDGRVVLLRTRMARGSDPATDDERAVLRGAGVRQLETNDDLGAVVDHLVAQPETRCIVMAAAVCDWQPVSLDGDSIPFGKGAERLRSDVGQTTLGLTAADKIVQRVRRNRKDVFLVAFKATAGATDDALYGAGLRVLKRSSANLVLANDVRTHTNLVVTPEEFPYRADNRKHAVRLLCEMIAART